MISNNIFENKNINNIIINYIRQIEYLDLINKYKNNWHQISGYNYLTEEFMEYYKNKIIIDDILIYQILTEEFINKIINWFNLNEKNWIHLYLYQNLSEEFIYK